MMKFPIHGQVKTCPKPPTRPKTSQALSAPLFPPISSRIRALRSSQINFCLSSRGPTNSLAQAMPMKPRALKMVMSLLNDLGKSEGGFPPYQEKPKDVSRTLLSKQFLTMKSLTRRVERKILRP